MLKHIINKINGIINIWCKIYIMVKVKFFAKIYIYRINQFAILYDTKWNFDVIHNVRIRVYGSKKGLLISSIGCVNDNRHLSDLYVCANKIGHKASVMHNSNTFFFYDIINDNGEQKICYFTSKNPFFMRAHFVSGLKYATFSIDGYLTEKKWDIAREKRRFNKNGIMSKSTCSEKRMMRIKATEKNILYSEWSEREAEKKKKAIWVLR